VGIITCAAIFGNNTIVQQHPGGASGAQLKNIITFCRNIQVALER
jgi:hypothetical protein